MNPLLSLLPVKTELIRKNNINLYYLFLDKLSFICVPLISIDSAITNNFRLLLKKKKLNSVFLKINYSIFKFFDFTNNNLIIFFKEFPYNYIDDIRLLLLIFNFELELVNCYFYYINNYYIQYSMFSVLNNIEYLNNICVNFIMDLIIFDIIYFLIDILSQSYFFLVDILTIKLLDGNFSAVN